MAQQRGSKKAVAAPKKALVRVGAPAEMGVNPTVRISTPTADARPGRPGAKQINPFLTEQENVRVECGTDGRYYVYDLQEVPQSDRDQEKTLETYRWVERQVFNYRDEAFRAARIQMPKE